MDLQLAFRVLWRFRILVAVGLFLGIFLAVLATARISLTSSPHFSYRTQPDYESTTNVFVTTPGFPFGSLTMRPGGRVADSPNGPVDLDNLRNAATLYVQYGTGNGVMRFLRASGPIHGKIAAFPITSPDGSSLPLIGLAADAHTKAGALELARRHLRAFQAWLLDNQIRNGTQPANRLILEPVSGPLPAKLIQGRKLTKPILVFAAMLVLTVGLAFALENMRPRIRSVEEAPEERTPRPERLSA